MKQPLWAAVVLSAVTAHAQQATYRWAVALPQVSAAGSFRAEALSSLAQVFDEGRWERTLLPEERQERWRQEREGELRQARSELSRARADLDRARLIWPLEHRDRQRAQQNFELALQRVEELERRSSQEAPRNEPAHLPLEQWPGADRFSSVGEDVRAWARQERVDLVFLPRLVEVRGYLGLRIQAWGLVTTPLTYEDWMSLEELQERLALAKAWMRTVLLNRPWAAVRVRAEPSTARIWIDGKLRGLGLAEVGPLHPGELRLAVEAEGYLTHTEVLTLEEGQIRETSVTLLPNVEATVVLDSEPSGARVWIGGVYQGLTPVRIPRFLEPRYVEIEREGYTPLSLSLQDVQGDLLFRLEPASPPRRLEEARGWFYGALASFTLSFFTTILFRGLEVEYRQLSNDFVQDYLATPPGFRTQEMLDKVNFSYTLQQTFQNGGYALAGLSAVLFGWTVWELLRYIEVAERGR